MLFLVSTFLAGAGIFLCSAGEPNQVKFEDLSDDKYFIGAFDKISTKASDNPKRSYKYVVGILQTEAEKER